MEDCEKISALLHIGDIVSLHAEGGFLSTLGALDDRCAVESGSSYSGEPNHERDSWFEVCSDKGCGKGRSLDANDSAAEVPVQYGQAIRFLHLRSNRLLALKGSVLGLANDEKEASTFSIKLRAGAAGTAVAFDVEVELSVHGAAETLQLAADDVEEHKDRTQVIALNDPSIEQTAWRICLFMNHAEHGKDTLKSGDIVRLFHEEKEKFLTLDEFQGQDYVFLRTTGREAAANAKSSKGLWEVQISNGVYGLAGAGRWTSHVFFRHVATGLFLGIDCVQDPRYVSAVYPRLSRSTKFVFEPSHSARKDEFIPRASSVRLQNLCTTGWICSTDVPVDKEEEKPVMTRLVCSAVKEEKETFAIIPASLSEVQDLDFVISAAKVLKRLIASLESGKFVQKEADAAARLLPKMADFILKREIGGGNSMDETPDRDRQKLLREQHILGNLFEILHGLLDGNVSDGEDNSGSVAYTQIRHLSCNVLRLSQLKYRKNREYITDRCNLLKKTIGYDERAGDTLASNRPIKWKILDEIIGAIDC